MMETPRISIITIVLNGANHIEQALESVLSQDYPELEYIVIDGGSDDGTLDVLRKYETKIDCLISEPDQGISDAFNKGVRIASGELIGLLNADDQYAPQSLWQLAEAYDHEGVYYGNMQIIRDNTPAETFFPDHELLDKDMTLSHPSCFISASVYEKYGLYSLDYKLAMDYELLLRFKCNGVSFYYIDRVLSFMSDLGASNQQWKLAFTEVQHARDTYLPISKIDKLKVFLIKIRKTIGHSLMDGPLKPLVMAYRRRFSLVRHE